LPENELFENSDCTKKNSLSDEYEECVFKNCNFYETDLSSIVFRECVFENCDFSLAVFNNTTLNDVKFTNCKLTGVHFDKCNDFLLSVEFAHCLLNLSSFYKLPLPKTKFTHCNLHAADFTETDLTGSVFDDCDLRQAKFQNTHLEKVDFSSALNYSINPEANRIKNAVFSMPGVLGLLDRYDIKIE
jgi:uncharacterized protein YjbI with pentapeptide repeats